MVAEKTLDEFVRRARESAGTNLQAVVLYGSAAAGDFDPEFSNLNLFCVLRDASFASLQALLPLMKWWDRQNEPPPLLMTADEFQTSADVFPIEFMDMQHHHRILFGEDPVSGLEISRQLHRTQVEYELREKLILLRQHIIMAGGSEKRLQELLLHSLPSIVTLFRHALIAIGFEGSFKRREAVQALAGKVGFDPAAIIQALDIREQKTRSRKLDIKALLGNYVSAVEKVIAAVDQAVC
jgi:hypothetical protein